MSPPLERVARWTNIPIVWLIIVKITDRVDAGVATSILAVKGSHVRADTSLLQAPVIIDCSVLLVTDDRLDHLIGVDLMLFNQILHPAFLFDVSGGGLHRGARESLRRVLFA